MTTVPYTAEELEAMTSTLGELHTRDVAAPPCFPPPTPRSCDCGLLIGVVVALVFEAAFVGLCIVLL
jgi:hypothetical protein